MAVSSRLPAQTHAVASTLMRLPRVTEVPRCRGTAACGMRCPSSTLNTVDFPEMGLCDPCRVCSRPFHSPPSESAHSPLLLPGPPMPCARPRAAPDPRQGREGPPGQPERCPPLPLPSAAESTARRAAGPPRQRREGRPPPRPAPPRPGRARPLGSPGPAGGRRLRQAEGVSRKWPYWIHSAAATRGGQRQQRSCRRSGASPGHGRHRSGALLGEHRRALVRASPRPHSLAFLCRSDAGE